MEIIAELTKKKKKKKEGGGKLFSMISRAQVQQYMDSWALRHDMVINRVHKEHREQRYINNHRKLTMNKKAGFEQVIYQQYIERSR